MVRGLAGRSSLSSVYTRRQLNFKTVGLNRLHDFMPVSCLTNLHRVIAAVLPELPSSIHSTLAIPRNLAIDSHEMFADNNAIILPLDVVRGESGHDSGSQLLNHATFPCCSLSTLHTTHTQLRDLYRASSSTVIRLVQPTWDGNHFRHHCFFLSRFLLKNDVFMPSAR